MRILLTLAALACIGGSASAQCFGAQPALLPAFGFNAVPTYGVAAVQFQAVAIQPAFSTLVVAQPQALVVHRQAVVVGGGGVAVAGRSVAAGGGFGGANVAVGRRNVAVSGGGTNVAVSRGGIFGGRTKVAVSGAGGTAIAR